MHHGAEPQLNYRLEKGHDTVYRQVGGRETCLALSKAFHDRVGADPVLKDLFPKDLDRVTERFAMFIAERTGGPKDYVAKRGKTSLECRHAHLSIGDAEREAWLSHMFAALDEVGVIEPARAPLLNYFVETARYLSDSLLPLYTLPHDELRTALERDPGLATASDAGRTLLAHAALHWDVRRVELLLKHGADVNANDRLGHDALYQATRSGSCPLEADGSAVVEMLIRHGAAVNRPSGPGRSTALHMAARRGHLAIAEVLLRAGANIESRDSKGETPLRRAVNCGQTAMVVLLLSRGADPFSQDKHGRIALSAARNEQIREALQSLYKTGESGVRIG